MGGVKYVDVGADVPLGSLISMIINPPSSPTHVLFGAGLKDEDNLELAVIAEKKEIF